MEGLGGMADGLGRVPGFSSVEENLPISAAAFFRRCSRETATSASKAEVVYPLDGDFANNRAQHNIEIARTHSPADFEAQVFNTSDTTVRVEIGGQCSNGECQGWSYVPEDDGFEMLPDACPLTLDFRLEPIASNAPRQIQVDWAVNGVTLQGATLELGGFSTGAVIGCPTTNLAFVDGSGAPPKSRMTWSPDASFSACPPVFDVARGPLPISPYPGPPARGDSEKEVYVYDPKGRRDPFVPLTDIAKEKPARKKGSAPIENFDAEEIKVIATPGHTRGSVSFLWRDRVFTGDSLFIGGLRTHRFSGR